MTKLPRHADRDLLLQVMGTVALLLITFIEIAFGQYPVFFGSTPHLMVMATVLIALYLPVALPSVAVVLAGIMFDLVQGAPLGYSTGLLFLALITVLSRRAVLIHADAATIWYEFALLLFGLQLYCLAVIVFWSGEIPAIRPIMSQYAVTVLLFPVLNWAFAPLRMLDFQERSS